MPSGNNLRITVKHYKGTTTTSSPFIEWRFLYFPLWPANPGFQGHPCDSNNQINPPNNSKIWPCLGQCFAGSNYQWIHPNNMLPKPNPMILNQRLATFPPITYLYTMFCTSCRYHILRPGKHFWLSKCSKSSHLSYPPLEGKSQERPMGLENLYYTRTIIHKGNRRRAHVWTHWAIILVQ